MSDAASATNAFVFADHLVLDESPTRDFYRELMQGLVHKNNNVFGVIQGFSSLILMEDNLDSSVRENVEQMKESSQQASDLAKAILTAGGCARVTPEATSLSDLLPWIETSAKETCQKYGVELQFNAASNLPEVIADSTKINELISELVKNAADAASGQTNGIVAIDVLKVSADEDTVDLFVRNSSPDIAPDRLLKLFEPFYTSKDPSVSSGLGLTSAGVLAGQMKMRLGLRCAEGTMTTWLSMKVA